MCYTMILVFTDEQNGEAIMKNILLLGMLLFASEICSASYNEFSENGICIRIKNNVNEPLLFKVSCSNLKLSESSKRESVSIYGVRGADFQNAELFLTRQNGCENLLKFTFDFSNESGGILDLVSVMRETPRTQIKFGLFQRTEGGGKTYTLFVDQDEKSIKKIENENKRPGTKKRKALVKVDIGMATPSASLTEN